MVQLVHVFLYLSNNYILIDIFLRKPRWHYRSVWFNFLFITTENKHYYRAYQIRFFITLINHMNCNWWQGLTLCPGIHLTTTFLFFNSHSKCHSWCMNIILNTFKIPSFHFDSKLKTYPRPRMNHLGATCILNEMVKKWSIQM